MYRREIPHDDPGLLPFHVRRAEVGGFNIGSVVMEVGQAQGSPLSPLLFKGYLDSCVRGLKKRAYAMSLEECVRYGLYLLSAPDELQTDTIVSKWFADDGTVMEHVMSRLHWWQIR